MVGFGFWKHLEQVMGELERESIEKLEHLPTDQMVATHVVSEMMGVRRTVKRIREEVEQYTQ